MTKKEFIETRNRMHKNMMNPAFEEILIGMLKELLKCHEIKNLKRVNFDEAYNNPTVPIILEAMVDGEKACISINFRAN